MGTQNKRFGAIRDLSLIESRRMQLQTAIDNGKSIESRRRFGQFATPYELAQEIMSFGLTLQDKKEISTVWYRSESGRACSAGWKLWEFWKEQSWRF